MTYTKDFDVWNQKKKKLDKQEVQTPFFKEREIWWLSIGVNIGSEEDGKQENFLRPVLIVKKFNRSCFLGIPMSNKLKNNQYYIPVTVNGHLVSVLLAQMRLFSSKRMFYRLAKLKKNDYNQVVIKARQLIFLPLPQEES